MPSQDSDLPKPKTVESEAEELTPLPDEPLYEWVFSNPEPCPDCEHWRRYGKPLKHKHS